MDVQLAVTEDGGKSWRVLASKDKHVDNHAMAFDPADPDYFLVGTDGGIYQTWDLGQSYQYTSNLPVTQFYKVAVDYDEPFYHIMGGTQDNNTQYGPSRTDHVHGITNADWRVTLFGDGHQPAIDPTNPDIYYCSLQQCNMYRVDRPTGEFISIKPVPGKGETKDRWNWDGPILISSHDPARLYMASQRLWRSDDRGDSWRPLSGDLTLGVDRLLQPMMDRVQSVDGMWDLVAMSEYGTITSLAESPLDENLIYVGTDDGLIHATPTAGSAGVSASGPAACPRGSMSTICWQTASTGRRSTPPWTTTRPATSLLTCSRAPTPANPGRRSWATCPIGIWSGAWPRTPGNRTCSSPAPSSACSPPSMAAAGG
jgi:hypothetical protein